MSEPNDPGVLLHDAILLERAGRLAEAEAAYVRLLSRWPELPDTWYNLALLQRRAGRFDAALASYQQALDRGVTAPEEVHLNRGVIYSDCLRQPAAAEKELHAALALSPRYTPALLNLANLKEDVGERSAAAALYARILEGEPRNYEALARYTSLAGPTTLDDPSIARLQAALRDPTASAAERASLGFALGKALDACGAYEQAFAAYVTANGASRALEPRAASLYDRGKHEMFIDGLIGVFTQERSMIAASSAEDAPIFICGMFRSGSTLIEQVLAAHPGVTAGGELPFIPALARNELAPFPQSMTRVSAAQVESLAARYRQMLATMFPSAKRVTDKRPDNFLYLGLIKTLFPRARIIHTTRNPLDNCLSIYFLHLDHSMGYALDLLDTGHYYAQYRRLMRHWQSLYGDDILEVDYDAFVHDPRPLTAALLKFCGLDWDERCLSFHLAHNAVRTASVWQVREPLYQRSSGRWRNYAAQLAPLRSYLQELGVTTPD